MFGIARGVRARTGAQLQGSFNATRTPCRSYTAPKAKDAKLIEILRQQLQDIEKAGTYKRERVIVSSQSPVIYVDRQGKKQEVLNFWYAYAGVYLCADSSLVPITTWD